MQGLSEDRWSMFQVFLWEGIVGGSFDLFQIKLGRTFEKYEKGTGGWMVPVFPSARGLSSRVSAAYNAPFFH